MLGDSSVGDVVVVVVVQVPLEAGAWVVGGDGGVGGAKFREFCVGFPFLGWLSVFFHSKLLD